jgi:hypothetical protein
MQDQINIVDTAKKTGIPRSHLSGIIASWETSGWITTTPTQVRCVFRLMKPLEEMPKTNDEIEKLVDALYEVMEKREVKDVSAIRKVIEIATEYECELVF